MAIQNIDHYIEGLPKERRDWLEVFGNQWAPAKQMPGTCEACVWGESNHLHAKDCVTGRGAVLRYVETIRTDARHVVLGRIPDNAWANWDARAMNDLTACQVEVIEKSLNPPCVR